MINRAIFLLMLLAPVVLKAQGEGGSSDFETYCISNGWYLSEVPKEKLDGNKGQLKAIAISQGENVDLGALGIRFDESAYQYFQVNNSQTILTVKPLRVLRSEWEKQGGKDE